jgi:tRNA A-37 threonylcarbamoyl transferase component Bud32
MADSRAPVVKPGDTVEGRYRIVKPLDEGGMGTVFLAEHVLIKRKLAIKVLRPELAEDADVVERFMNEARAAGTLGHPNIVESTDMGFTRDGIPYIVFEFLEGTLLVDEIYRLRGLPVRRALKIAHQIASALDAAHRAGIVHRDLKSENVFLTDKDERPDHVKVLDFGISRFLETESDSRPRKGNIMGTPEFMAPEQITTPDKVDRRADIYALGVIIYEMITARRPFRNDDDPQAVLHAVVHDPPPPLTKGEAPPGLSEVIIDKLLAKNPDERYQTMRELQGALEAFYNVARPAHSLTPISIPVPPSVAQAAPAPAAPTMPIKRSKSKAGLILLAVGIIAVGAGVALKLADTGALGKADNAPDPAAVAAVQADADKLGAALDGDARAARLRADTIAQTPMLRAAIETDAATIKDMAASEHLFAQPKPGEVLEVFQLKNDKTLSLLRVPEAAPALAAGSGSGDLRVDSDGQAVLVVASAPITAQSGAVAGAIVVSSTVDLTAIKRGIAEHALGATLLGRAKPLELAKPSRPGSTVTLHVPTGKEIGGGEITLSAVLAPGVEAKKNPYGTISYAFLGIGGALLLLYLGSLLRARREG